MRLQPKVEIKKLAQHFFKVSFTGKLKNFTTLGELDDEGITAEKMKDVHSKSNISPNATLFPIPLIP
mgnify:CR=1 FL=1